MNSLRQFFLFARIGPHDSTAFGVEGFVERLERRRLLIQRLHVVARTEYLDLLEQLISLLYEKIQPRHQQKP